MVQRARSRGVRARMRMRPSALNGTARLSGSNSGSGTSTASEMSARSAAKTIRCSSHSSEWPSASGSKTRTLRGPAELSLGDQGIEPAREGAEDQRLGVMLLDESAPAAAEFAPELGVVGKLEHRLGEPARLVGRHAQEGPALALQVPEGAVG